ncbi:head-tail adaptor protein [Pseudomonas iridis]|uniref:head-tail adaptor protein n=1 Tax=Pseudomonas iridis TaxID=2710587 RepID=UPI001B3258B6|nr:head-tail adaptor protein [Pseudomonas iridis]MBP5971067.1 head-tail adaptor protein [Pseudomonas iridis]
MRAGPLRHRCSLQQEERVPDGFGGYTQGWSELRKIWVEIGLPGGRTAVVAQQITALISAELLARPAADLQVGLRIVDGSTRYLVEAVLPDNQHSLLRLPCSLVPAQEA